MRKLICVAMALLMFALAGCHVFAEEEAFRAMDIEEVGASLALPKDAVDNYMLEVAFSVEPEDAMDLGEAIVKMAYIYYFPELNEMYERGEQISEEIIEEMSRAVCEVWVYPEGQLGARVEAGEALDQVMGLAACAEIGRQDGRVYLFGEHPADAAGMSENTAAMYEELRAQMPEIKQRTKLIPIVEPAPFSADESAIEAGTVVALEGADMDGNPVDTKELFKKAKLTMVNIWATFCGPCINEMPDLGRMAEAMPEGSQLVGVITDFDGNEDLAKEILEKSNAKFFQIIPDANKSTTLQSVMAVPTTLFVDHDGKLVGEPVVGSRSEADYVKEIEARLK